MQAMIRTKLPRVGTTIFTVMSRLAAECGAINLSLTEVAAACGMSQSSFYRYFPSKAAIVEALIAADLADMQRDFSAVITSADPMAMLRQCAGEIIMPRWVAKSSP